MANERIYTVFVRNWWKIEDGKLVANGGARRTKLADRLTYDEARKMCDEYEKRHKPGKLSRKAEFTSNY